MEPPCVTKAKFYGSLDQTAIGGHVKNHDGLAKTHEKQMMLNRMSKAFIKIYL